jgi:hypothetical protein
MLEVADVFREAGPDYRERFGARMLPSHLKAMWDIEQCRTEALGGHLRRCDHCNELQYSYHSCRNRHCPKCHGDRTQTWLDEQRARLLPCSYFLLTFTLPEQVRPLARSHQKTVYSILISCAAQALQKLTSDPRFLGARPGMLAVLHTWTRAMLHHPHAHFLVTAGGLTADGQAWRHSARRDFLVPCRALSVIFRAKVRDALRQAKLLDQLPGKIWRRKWVVHCQHAGNGDKVLQYVARYVHRIAITNSRLESFDAGQLTFRYRDSCSGQLKRCTLSAEQFIARFLQHVLPSRFTKVRYYGLFSPRCSNALEQARSLLRQSAQTLDASGSVQDTPGAIDSTSPDTDTPHDHLCPVCHVGAMRIIAVLKPLSRGLTMQRAPPTGSR